MQLIINDVLREITQKDKGNRVIFGKGYSSNPIKPQNFVLLSENKTDSKIAFIDGGNQEIIGGANFSLQLMRVYYCIYQGKKRIKRNAKECIVLVRVKENKGKLSYSVARFKKYKDMRDADFGAFDLFEGEHKIKPDAIAGRVRKLYELRALRDLIKEMDVGDIIVRDGDLDPQDDKEWVEIEQMQNRAQKKGVVLCGISKTNELLTETGESACAMIAEKMPAGKWCCGPIAESKRTEHKAEIHFVKLHVKSDYIFRFDVYREQAEKVAEVLERLSSVSCDPVFLGYPYGLVEADKFARVQNSEVEYYRMQLFLKGEGELKTYLKGVDAHSVLDSIG